MFGKGQVVKSKRDQLKDSIKENKGYRDKSSFDEANPFKGLDSYVVWLINQMSSMKEMETTKDGATIKSFFESLRGNGSLKTFLEQNFYTPEKLEELERKSFPEEDREYLFRVYRIWIRDQQELIANVLSEVRIQESLDSAGRERIRGRIKELNGILDEVAAQKAKAKKGDKQLEGLANAVCMALGLKWDLRNKTVRDLRGELNRRIGDEEKEVRQWSAEAAVTKAPSSYTGKLEGYKAKAVWHFRHHQKRLEILRGYRNDLDAWARQANDADAAILAGEAQLATKQQAAQQELDKHIKDFQTAKKSLDKSLGDERSAIERESEELNRELIPLLEDIARLNKDIVDYEAAPEIKGHLKASIPKKKLQLEVSYKRKDEIFLKLGYLRDQMTTIKDAYTDGIKDEKEFREHAQRQLGMIKTIPKIEEAMNVYCTNYNAAFPMFLWVGGLVHGSGDIIQSDTPVGKVVDVAFKVALTPQGQNDMRKVKSFDTGSMALSLKLGLSIGLGSPDGTAGKIGLAVEYNGAINVPDNRSFQTVASFALLATGSVGVPKFFKGAFEVELLKWQGGFQFQDHYHWAAWMAARWGHFAARAWACDVYMTRNRITSDLVIPDQKTLQEIQEMTDTYCKGDNIVGNLYSEIRQYLEFPVKRTSHVGMFTGANANLDFFVCKAGAEVSREPTHLFIMENENGQWVEYKTKYHVLGGNGSFELTLDKLPMLSKIAALGVSVTKTKDHPTEVENGTVVNILLPVPSPVVAAKAVDILVEALMSKSGTGTTGDQVKEILQKFATDSMKLLLDTAVSKCIEEGLLPESLLLEKQKLVEISFLFPEGTIAESLKHASLQFLRTRLTFSKEFETSIPVYHALSIDVGGSFQYSRTCEEVASWCALDYLVYLYYSLKEIPKMKQPQKGKESYTIRPDAFSGEKLWEEYAKANKHQLWHLFLSIGSGAKGATEPLEKPDASQKARDFLKACQQEAKSGRYKLTTLAEAGIRIIPGYLPVLGQVFVSTVVKPGLKGKDASVFEQNEGAYNKIYGAFVDYLDDEIEAIKKREKSKKATQFQRVMPAPKTVEQLVGEVFRPQDSSLITAVKDAAELSRETYKHIKSCTRCLADVHDYDMARYILSSPVIPEKYWVDTRDQDNCGVCGCLIQSSNYLIKRVTNKHHCRVCGGIVCGGPKCSAEQYDPKISSSKIRICSKCWTLIQQKRIPVRVPARLPQSPSERERLNPKAAGSSKQLIVYRTVADPSSGIHAAVGSLDPTSGQYKHPDPQSVRREIGGRIKSSAGPHVAKYESRISDLLGHIWMKIQPQGRQPLTGEENRFWTAFQKIPNIQENLQNALAGKWQGLMGQAHSGIAIIDGIRNGVLRGSAAYDPIRDMLARAILDSGSKNDEDAKRRLSAATDFGKRRQVLQTLPADYIFSAVTDNLDVLIHGARSSQILDDVVRRYDDNKRETARLITSTFLPFVQGSSAAFREAYASALEQPGCSLHEQDMEMLAEVRSVALSIYRREGRSQFAQYIELNKAASTHIRVFQEGTYWLRAGFEGDAQATAPAGQAKTGAKPAAGDGVFSPQDVVTAARGSSLLRQGAQSKGGAARIPGDEEQSRREGAEGGEAALKQLARMEHAAWWRARIEQAIPPLEARRACEEFFTGDMGKAQESYENAKASQSEASAPTAVAAGKQKSVDPAIGANLEDLFDIIDVRPDGNCLFRSLAVALGQSEDLHLAYRRMAVEHMYRHQEDFNHVYTDNFMAYLYTMSEAAQGARDTIRYGSDPEIGALSQLIGREIIVYGCQSELEGWEVKEVIRHESGADSLASRPASTPILIGYQDRRHYVCLNERGD